MPLPLQQGVVHLRLFFLFQIQKKSKMEDKPMEEQEIKYTLLVNKKRIAVDKEVYKAYYQQKEREAYLDKLASKHNISFEECEEKGIQVDYLLSHIQESIEDKIIMAEMIKKLMLCLDALSDQERLLICNLFFKGKSESEAANELGVNQSTINRRKSIILKKIKKFMEI